MLLKERLGRSTHPELVVLLNNRDGLAHALHLPAQSLAPAHRSTPQGSQRPFRHQSRDAYALSERCTSPACGYRLVYVPFHSGWLGLWFGPHPTAPLRWHRFPSTRQVTRQCPHGPYAPPPSHVVQCRCARGAAAALKLGRRQPPRRRRCGEADVGATPTLTCAVRSPRCTAQAQSGALGHSASPKRSRRRRADVSRAGGEDALGPAELLHHRLAEASILRHCLHAWELHRTGVCPTSACWRTSACVWRKSAAGHLRTYDRSAPH